MQFSFYWLRNIIYFWLYQHLESCFKVDKCIKKREKFFPSKFLHLFVRRNKTIWFIYHDTFIYMAKVISSTFIGFCLFFSRLMIKWVLLKVDLLGFENFFFWNSWSNDINISSQIWNQLDRPVKIWHGCDPKAPAW